MQEVQETHEVQEVQETKLHNSILNYEGNFVSLETVQYTQDGIDKEWECVKSMDSVHIAVFDEDAEIFYLAKQVRIPVLVNDSSNDGIVYELCAGCVDKDKSIEEIAQEEVQEELGFDVPLDKLMYVKSLKSSVGTSGSTSHLFSCKVNSSMRVNAGGGTEHENIEVHELHFEDFDQFMWNSDVHTDAITMMSLCQFRYEKL